MIHPLELFIGLRYTRAKQRNRFASFISVMATLGIILGVAAMITVLSVMNGFGKELRHRILSVVSHVTVESIDGSLGNWKSMQQHLLDNANVKAVAPYVDGEGLLAKGTKSQGVVMRGIDPGKEKQVSQFADKLVTGDIDALKPGSHSVVLGKVLAETLGAKPGSRVVLITDTGRSEISSPRLTQLKVAGIFDVGMYQQDKGLVLLNIQDAMKIFSSPGHVTGLRLRLNDAYQARTFAERLQQDLGEFYIVNNWMNRHSNFFIALQDQKRIMFLVLMLVVSVAAFNIVSTLVMMVTDKQSDIAILRTVGMSPGSVMLVFIFQGMLVASIGIIAGVLLGIVIAANSEIIVHGIEQILNMKLLSPDIYPITDLPSDIQLADITKIISAALIVSFLSTIYPAWRAARTQPALALRYE
ncbi:MAG: lipoprotein-releasing ABC transporter permease subunit [Acidiferrobacterales bacterium]|nr:lipoprotein-releasing ABC transporter permease subunit [Acidiferrobacterales bacterium]